METAEVRRYGFRDTEIGMLPQDWEIKRIADACRVVTGGTPSTKHQEYFGGDVEWLKSGDIKGLYIYHAKEKITVAGLENSNARIYPADSLAIALSGRGQTRGRTAIIKVPMACSQSVAFLIPNPEITSEFLHYYLSERYHQIRNLTGHYDRSGLNLSIVGGIKIPVPPLSEQVRIVGVLRSIYRAAEEQDKVIATTARLKKSLMQNLFTEGIGHTEFKDGEIGQMPKSWQVVKLDDTINLAQYGLSQKGDRQGQYPIIRMNNLEDGGLSLDDMQYVSLDDGTFRHFRLAKGDILFNRTNSADLVGKTSIFEIEDNFVFASYLIRLRTRSDMMLPEFLNHYMNWNETQRRLKGLATRAVGQSNISASRLRTLTIPLPPIAEQLEIASTLRTVTRKTKVEEQRKTSLRQLFKMMLHKLMTGEIRVKDLDLGVVDVS